MADDCDEPERAWDEHDWERFLQQQDSKTERYMELFEKYMDDPARDQIIAREMGWPHLLEPGPEDLEEIELEDLKNRQLDEEKSDSNPSFESHPLYRNAFSVTASIDLLFEELPEIASSPLAVKMASQVAVASAKLAAALSDHGHEEIGMTIAYLKRALRAISTAMEAAWQLEQTGAVPRDQGTALNRLLFAVRDGIIALMGDLRAEWRRRFG